jgi:hypothetical protein
MADGIIASPNSLLPDGSTIIGMAMLQGMGYLCIFDLAVLVTTTFRRKDGLYFWSIVVGLIGVCQYSIGASTYLYIIDSRLTWLNAVLLNIGYLAYVPSEFAVLYSRLTILSTPRRTLRFLLVSASTEFLLLTLPSAIIQTALVVDSQNDVWFKIIHRLQKCEAFGYAAMGISFSAVYIYEIRNSWHKTSNPKVSKVLKQLVCTSILTAVMQMVNIILTFTGPWQIQLTWLVSNFLTCRDRL